MVQAQKFPLSWPVGRPRAKSRSRSAFASRSVAAALAILRQELGRLSAHYVVISTNIPLKPNGDPYSDPGRMADPGVAVYFQLRGKPYCLPCDRWTYVEDNLYAVAKHIEAMRGMERWGVGTVEQAFAGMALPASTAGESWWTVLGCSATATEAEIQAAYRAKAKQAHADVGGSDAAMARLNVARDQALSVVRGGA